MAVQLIQNEIDFILSGCINILGAPYIDDTFNDTRVISAKFLTAIISGTQRIFGAPVEASEKINFVLYAIQNSIVIPNRDLYAELLKILLEIVFSYFSIIPQFMLRISEYISIGLNHEEQPFIFSSLEFWIQIALHEKAIRKRDSARKQTEFNQSMKSIERSLSCYQPISIFIEFFIKIYLSG